MVVATVAVGFFSERSWGTLLAAVSVFAGLVPHAGGLMRPPLGQLPGLSLLINYSLCFAHRYVLLTLLFLTYTAWARGGVGPALASAEVVVALEGLLIHLLNWYRYQRISRDAAANVNTLLADVAVATGEAPLVACDDGGDELGRLQRTWLSLFTFGPLVVTLARLFQPYAVRLHRNVQYLRRGEAGGGPACYMDIEYSTDPASYRHFKRRPVAIYMHGGAWCFGNKFINAGPTTRWFLARRGFIVVSIGYRFAPFHPWPAQLRCLAHAMRWVHRNYGRHAALPSAVGGGGGNGHDASVAAGPPSPSPPIVLIGGSAGAHVSMTYSLVQALVQSGGAARLHPDMRAPVEAAVREGVVPTAVVAFYPPTDMTDALGSYLKFPVSLPPFFRAAVGPSKGQSMFSWFFHRVVSQRSAAVDAGTREEEFVKSGCPMELLAMLQAHSDERSALAARTGAAADAPSVCSTLPPLLTIHCGGDGVVPVASSIEFMDRLAAFRRSAHFEVISRDGGNAHSGGGGDGSRVAQHSQFKGPSDAFLDVPTVGHSFDILLSHLSANASRAVYAWATSLLRHRERCDGL